VSWNTGYREVCPRCKSTKQESYTELFCPNGCAEVAPGAPCLKCGSTNTELFEIGPWAHIPEGTRHCLDCGSLLPPVAP
jgi:hypothetical protein